MRTPGRAGRGDWLDAVERLTAEGKIRFFGLSLNDHAAADARPLLETGVVDALQLIYNALDQSAEDELLPAALAANVGVLARVPLDEGGLTGKITPGTTEANAATVASRPLSAAELEKMRSHRWVRDVYA